MFFWRKRLKEKLETLENMLETALTRLDARDEERERLIAQNKELFDRLMSRNFEEFRIYQPSGYEDLEMGTKGIDPDQDEENAGEILTLEESQ